MVFFCISGYLVTQSWYRQPEFPLFLWKRVLRLWPGMLGSVIFGVFLFGLLSSNQTLADYLRSPATWHFFWINLTLIQEYGTIPGTFANNPRPGAVNGVYWTIPMEFTCYLVLAGLGLFGILRKTAIFKTILLIYIAGFLWLSNPDITGRINHWIEYPAFFAAGALIALHQEWFRRHGGKLLLCIIPFLAVIYFLTPYSGTSRFLAIPPLIIYLGSLPARETWFSRLGDPSYGIYLYGYPIAQSVEALWPDMGFLTSLLLTFALSICAGYASWIFIESRALRWKNSHPSFKKLTNTS